MARAEHIEPVQKILCNCVVVGDKEVGKTTFIGTICGFGGMTYMADPIARRLKFNKEIIFLSVLEQVLGAESIMRIMMRQRPPHIIFVYDITNAESFTAVKRMIESERPVEHGSFAQQFILVGTKSDLTDRRVVAFADAKALADHCGMPFFEVNSTNPEMVNAAFDAFICQIVQKNYPKVFTTHCDKVKEQVTQFLAEIAQVKTDLLGKFLISSAIKKLASEALDLLSQNVSKNYLAYAEQGGDLDQFIDSEIDHMLSEEKFSDIQKGLFNPVGAFFSKYRLPEFAKKPKTEPEIASAAPSVVAVGGAVSHSAAAPRDPAIGLATRRLAFSSQQVKAQYAEVSARDSAPALPPAYTPTAESTTAESISNLEVKQRPSTPPPAYTAEQQVVIIPSAPPLPDEETVDVEPSAPPFYQMPAFSMATANPSLFSVSASAQNSFLAQLTAEERATLESKACNRRYICPITRRFPDSLVVIAGSSAAVFDHAALKALPGYGQGCFIHPVTGESIEVQRVTENPLITQLLEDLCQDVINTRPSTPTLAART